MLWRLEAIDKALFEEMSAGDAEALREDAEKHKREETRKAISMLFFLFCTLF